MYIYKKFYDICVKLDLFTDQSYEKIKNKVENHQEKRKSILIILNISILASNYYVQIFLLTKIHQYILHPMYMITACRLLSTRYLIFLRRNLLLPTDQFLPSSMFHLSSPKKEKIIHSQRNYFHINKSRTKYCVKRLLKADY